MDLTTSYLGLSLPHPLVVGASPLSADLGQVRRLEDAGMAALVMSSLFEEQIRGPLPAAVEGISGPEEYLEHLVQVRSAVEVPVIASLNGVSLGGWLEYARQIEEAGADALELNVYRLVVDPFESGEAVERRVREMISRLREVVALPVAVKLSPFHTSLAHFARQLDEAGSDGLVLFNRFYQPDLDLEELRVVPTLNLSTSEELRLRLRWLAVLHRPYSGDLAASGGVHTAEDALKAVLAGASAVQVVSALLAHGPERLTALRDGLTRWLEEHGHGSVEEIRGRLSLASCPDPETYERANYLQVLASWNDGGERREAGGTGWEPGARDREPRAAGPPPGRTTPRQ